ncbi:wax ester/triacylglycerol synthase family O-acyltransferase [Mycolicibacterium boenickei]|uniref:Diacylglycerol O-acyltransferase n=1 Tax=Mycolicibacterium boenickei TaxID=146017 RepID=A0AAX3A2Y2_9MYCO|nr:wax ester/triacylglycerol synthase family O-acyltransferase [Mycolicibacterium boenickei]PEG57435.1 wax ester/triacylglycerol synthase family O-acyltransferase [Mycolicibacterium boenickei]UNC01739.1 wax ester/triacylglycerol synthase family O-acyltransferase [Mycolicibacterium boenickei]BBX91661.1 diacylglycerol O-acyltransferase [Mycolicibacterium boenickei]
MSDVPELDAAGLPEELSAVDQLLHRGEANPRTRSGILGVEILDTTPDWERFRARLDYASRKVLRLRQKVVMPTLPTAAPRWVVDPDFNLDYHVRRVRVPEPGTLRDVFDLAEIALQSPMDISRPLWSATLVEGLAGGRAATILHLSHAVSDGVGIVEMFANIYDLERDPEPTGPAPLPIPQDLSPNDLMREGISRLPGSIAGGVLGALGQAARTVTKVVRDPVSAVNGVVDYAMSGARVMGPAAHPSPLLRRRSLSSRTEAIDIPFSDLHRAAKAAGGSINDAYLAGLCGALRLYHDAKGISIETLPMAVPVNLRSEDDPAGGNRFAGVNLAAPVGIVDAETRIKAVRSQMMSKREERAIDIVGSIAPVLGLLPDAVLETVAGSVVNSDVQASNVPVYPGDTFIAGAKILRHYGIGPLPGVAMMVVLISRSGYITVTTRYDRAAISDEKLFAQCLLAGFDEVLALGGDGRAEPASFSSETSATNGSAAQ